MSLQKTLALSFVAALTVGALASGASATAVAYVPASDDTSNVIDAPFVNPDTFKIVDAGTDAMGADRFVNRNREWFTFQNVSGVSQKITDWATVDAWAKGDTSDSSCNTFVFKTSNVSAGLVSGGEVSVPAGSFVRVHTGAGTPSDETTNEPFKVYMNSNWKCGANGHYITNDGDDLYLVNGSGHIRAHSKFARKGGYETVFAG